MAVPGSDNEGLYEASGGAGWKKEMVGIGRGQTQPAGGVGTPFPRMQEEEQEWGRMSPLAVRL